MIVRLATEDDLGAIVALLADDAVAIARGGYAAEVTDDVRAAFREIAADDANELWVGELDGQVIATLQLTFIPGLSRGGQRRALVEAVRVHAELRGRGLGAAFMAAAEARARARGCGLIQLTTDLRRTEAHRFYARLGYVASHAGMKKPL